jgi:hypothetical protein
MRTLTYIVAVLLIVAAIIYGGVAIYGFFVLDISYLNTMLAILMMVLSVMVGVNLIVIAQEEE